MSRGTVEPMATTRIVAGTQIVQVMSLPISTPVQEHGAFGFHLFDSAVDESLVEFEVRDTVAHQTTDGVIALVYDHGVACTGKLLGACETGWAGTDHGTSRRRRCGGSGLTSSRLMPDR